MKNCKDKKSKKIAVIALSVAAIGTNTPAKVVLAAVPDTSGSAIVTPAPDISPSDLPVPSSKPSGEPESSKEPQVSEEVKSSEEPVASEDVCIPSEDAVPGKPIPSSAPVVSPDVSSSEAPQDSVGPTVSEEAVPSAEPGVPGNPDSSFPGVSEPGESATPPDEQKPGFPIAPGEPAPTTMPVPTKDPDGCYPDVYLPGDVNFLPDLYKDSEQGGNGRWMSGESWGDYDLVRYNNEQVILPGMLSDILQVEKETSLKKSKNVKWGNARTKNVNKLTKANETEETIPGTGDAVKTEWLFPAFVGSAALLAAFRCKKDENSKEV